MTVLGEDGSRKNEERKLIASTNTDSLEMMPSESQALLMEEFFVVELQACTQNMAPHALDQSLEVPGDVLMGENTWNDMFGCVKEEQIRLCEEMNSYKMEKQKLEDVLLENEVAMKEMKRSVLDLEKTVNHVRTKESLLMSTNKEPGSCLSETTTSNCRITDKLLKHK